MLKRFLPQHWKRVLMMFSSTQDGHEIICPMENLHIVVAALSDTLGETNFGFNYLARPKMTLRLKAKQPKRY